MVEQETIQKGINVIKYAITHQIPLKTAAIKFGFADNYIKKLKYRIKKNNTDPDDVLVNEFYDVLHKYHLNKIEREFGQKDNINMGNGLIMKDRDDSTSSKEIPTNQTKYDEDGDHAEFEWLGKNNYPLDHIKTLEGLLKAGKVDLDLWRVKSHVINKWDVTSWKSGHPETKQNFQVKAWLERKEEEHKERLASEVFKDIIKEQGFIPQKTEECSCFKRKLEKIAHFENENNLLEISLFDLHLGKLAWAGETGENYDTKIAKQRFKNALDTLLLRATSHNFDSILFPIGSDFFNSDSLFNTTTKGTPQDEDLRWQKTFKLGINLMVDAINTLLSTGKPVTVLVVPGNHDFQRSYYLGCALEAFYGENDMVTINNSASPRKYYNFGNLLLGFTHGNEEKESSLPMLMATENESKKLWSTTKYHEWHVGHIHRKRSVSYTVYDQKTMPVSENLGVTVRYLSSLTGTEEWHHKKGFVGQNKAGEAFIWNDEKGLIAQLNCNIEY